MELQLAADPNEDELAAESAAKSSALKAFERKRPSRKPFSEHLPRECGHGPSFYVTSRGRTLSRSNWTTYAYWVRPVTARLMR